MQRSASETQAANGALAHVGQPPVADLEQKTAAATAARSRFADVRDALLRERDWNFALGRVVPALEGPVGATGRKRYGLPEDCLGVRSVEGLGPESWSIEAASDAPGADAGLVSVLVTSTDAPRVIYTRRVENPALWDALFLDVFQLRLAAAVAPLIAKSQGLADRLDARAADRLATASRRDAREKAAAVISRDTSWLRSRGGFAPGNTWPWPHGWPPDSGS